MSSYASKKQLEDLADKYIEINGKSSYVPKSYGYSYIKIKQLKTMKEMQDEQISQNPMPSTQSPSYLSGLFKFCNSLYKNFDKLFI